MFLHFSPFPLKVFLQYACKIKIAIVALVNLGSFFCERSFQNIPKRFTCLPVINLFPSTLLTIDTTNAPGFTIFVSICRWYTCRSRQGKPMILEIPTNFTQNKHYYSVSWSFISYICLNTSLPCQSNNLWSTGEYYSSK